MIFPKTIFVDRNSILEQLDHLRSEVEEVREAVVRGDYDAAADELVDVQQSADTGLHILMQTYGADSYGAFTRVAVKNANRGYYATPMPPVAAADSPEVIS